MSKAKRKMRPQPPKWFWTDTDGCWRCKKQNACNGCKFLKNYVHNHKKKGHRQNEYENVS